VAELESEPVPRKLRNGQTRRPSPESADQTAAVLAWADGSDRPEAVTRYCFLERLLSIQSETYRAQRKVFV